MAKTLEQLKKELDAILVVPTPKGQGEAKAEPKSVIANAGENSGPEGGPMAQPEEKAPPEEDPAEPLAPEGPHPFLGAIAQIAKDFGEQLGFAPQSILLKPNGNNGWVAEPIAPALVTDIVGGPDVLQPEELDAIVIKKAVEDVVPPLAEAASPPAPIIVSKEIASALGMTTIPVGGPLPHIPAEPAQEAPPLILIQQAKPKAHKPSIHDLGKIKWFTELDGEGKSLNLWETPKQLLQHFGAPITDVPCRHILAWAKKNPEKAETILVVLEDGPDLSLLEAVHILDSKKEGKT